MQNPNDDRQALAGLTYCGSCRDPMVRMGTTYVCANGIINQESGCQSSAIDAGNLLRGVVGQIIRAVMHGPNLRVVKDFIQDRAEETAARLQTNLDQTELALAALNRREATLLTQLQGAGGETSAVRDELNDIADKRTALSHEARSSRREIDAQEFISDEGRITANAMDVDTFVAEATPEQTNEFIQNFVESLQVGPDFITIKYRFPIRSRENREGDIMDLFPRPDRNQTGDARTGTG